MAKHSRAARPVSAHPSSRVIERATLFGFLSGIALTSFCWWALLRALGVLS